MEPGTGNQKLKDILVWKNLRKKLLIFLAGHIKKFIFIISMLLVGFCVYIWYENIYAPEWSEMKKQEYIKTKEQVASFNKKGFESAVAEYELRSSENQKTLEDPVDIFRLKN